MTAPVPKHLEARVESARKTLIERLRGSGLQFPGDVTEAIDRLLMARLDVVRAETELPTSDEQDEAKVERMEPRAVLERFRDDVVRMLRMLKGVRPAPDRKSVV